MAGRDSVVPVSKQKARKFLKDGQIRGKPLTDQQKILFRRIANEKKKSRLDRS